MKLEAAFINRKGYPSINVQAVCDHEGPPETPTNFSVSGETESTVTLHWIPAFDGGHDQWFGVQYRMVGSHTWQETKVPDQIQFTDDELHSFLLPGLLDGTSYEIRVYAENKFNKSLPTDTEKISTKELTATVSSVGIAVGVSIVVVICIIIGGFFLYKMNLRRKKKPSDSHPSGNENTFADYYNINNQDTMLQRENCYEMMTPKEKDRFYTDLNNQNTDKNRKSSNYDTCTNNEQEKANVYDEIDNNKGRGSGSQLYVNTVF